MFTFLKTFLSPTKAVKNHAACILDFCLQLSRAEQTSSFQVGLESSNDLARADGNGGCNSNDASGDASGQ
jgi:hypothetical protein